MSRIGKLPVNLPSGVTVKVSDDVVSVKGPLGELTQELKGGITIEQEGDQIIVKRPSESKEHRSMHGLYRALINNMVEGVSKGYTLELEFVGVGYKAESKGQILEMGLGYSHEIHLQLPKEVQVEAKTEKRANSKVTLKSCDKQLVGQVAAKIRSLRKPEPYKGKGVRFVGEEIRKKAGKSAKV